MIQDSIITSNKPEILTAIPPLEYKYGEADYLIYPELIYFLSFILIISTSLLSVAWTKLRRRRMSQLRLTKHFLRHLYQSTFAHLDKIWKELPLKVLQLAILINVTILTCAYYASFSTEKVSIQYPKVFASYASIESSKPQVNVSIMSEQLIDFFRGDSFSPLQPEFYIQRMLLTKRYSLGISCPLLTKSYKEGKLVLMANGLNKKMASFNQVRTCLYFSKMDGSVKKTEKLRLFGKTDPGATELTTQFAISRSIDKKTRLKIRSKIRLLSENGLFTGIEKEDLRGLQRLYERVNENFNTKLRIEHDVSRCIVTMVKPRIEVFRSLDLPETRKLFRLFLMLPLASIILISEMLISIPLERNRYRRKRFRRFCM